MIKSFATEAEAILAQADAQKRMNQGLEPFPPKTLVEIETAKPTLSEYFETVHKPRLEQDLKHTSFVGVCTHFDLHIFPFFGKTRRLDEIRGSHLEDFVRHLAAKDTTNNYKNAEPTTLSRSTIHRILSSLSKLVKKAAIEHKFSNPFTEIDTGELRKLGKAKPAETGIEFFPETELNRLLSAAKAYDTEKGTETFVAILAAAHGGLRAGEQAALRWSDLDFERDIMTVARNYTKRRFTTPKSGSKKTVEMSPALVAELRAYRSRQRERFFGLGRELPELIFASPHALDKDAGIAKAHAKTPLDFNTFRKTHYKSVIERAGLAYRNWHALRHTSASVLIALGSPLAVVSRHLGHKSTDITERYYHTTKGAIAQGLSRMPTGDAPTAVNG